MEINSKNISVIGAGRSGIAAAKLIKQVGGIPFISDAGKEDELSDSINVLKLAPVCAYTVAPLSFNCLAKRIN